MKLPVNSVGSMIVRRLIPAVVILPVISGLIVYYFEMSGLFSAASAHVLAVIICIFCLVIYIVIVARSVGKHDREQIKEITLSREKSENILRENLDEFSKLNRKLNSLSRSSKAMMYFINEQHYLDAVCRIIVEDLGHKMVWIGFAQNDEKKSVLPAAYSGFDEGYINNLNVSWADNEFGRGPTGTAIRTGSIARCTNMLTDPAFEPWRAEAVKRGYASSIVLPLRNEDKTFGALSVYSKEDDPFSEDETTLLSEIADDLAYGITFIRLTVSEKKALSLIRESEEKYRMLFESMIEGFALHEIITDDDGNPCDYRFLSINPSFEKQTGMNAADLAGKLVTEALPGTEKYWIDTYGRVALTGESIEFENYHAGLNQYFRVKAFSPKKGYFAAIFENITDRKLAEKELNSTKNYLENLINFANAPIIVWDSEKRIRLFNHAFENLTGYMSDEVVGKNLDLLFPTESLSNSNFKIQEALSRNLMTVEIPILTKEKKIRTVLWNSANIHDPDNNNLISTIAQGNDITERIIAEELMRSSGEKLKLALQNGNIGTWEWDIEKDRMEWDERMEMIFGIEPGKFGGTYNAFEEYLAEEDIPHIRKAISNTFDKDVPFDTVFRIRKNGSSNYISSKASVIRGRNQRPVKMSGVCFDITEMKKGAESALFKLNEELLRSNRELEQFAYVASHDLQEPLRMVSSYTQLLLQRYDDKLEDDARDFIRFAVEGAVRMQNLINDLLEFSRIETRGRRFSLVDMNKALGIAVKNLGITIREKDAMVTNDELPVIMADESQIHILFQNLIGNALKFCKTPPMIHISSKEEADHFLISVKDNGIGIEPQYFNKIFRIFQRLFTKEEYGGTGIGLAICKRIVERHGGTIWVNSKKGKGSTFFFTIPR